MFYRRLCNHLEDKGKLIPAEDSPSLHGAKLGTPFKEYYTSIYKYNEEQYQNFQKVGSVKGVFDLIIDKLVFDFDGKIDKETPAPELALADAVEICNRLIIHGIKPDDLKISFSGACGFHVEVDIDEHLNKEEFKSITRNLAADLKYFDVRIFNASRIFRVLGSVNNKTGLYKIPLTLLELQTLSIEQIQEKAKSLSNVNRADFSWSVIKLPESIRALIEVKPEAVATNPVDLGELNIDFSKKVKGWSNCKWALTQGVGVKPGDRHEQLLCIAATAKALNNSKEQAYYMAKNAMKLGVKRYGGEECEKEVIWTKIESVYDVAWVGGTFTCREGKTPWLSDICNGLDKNKCSHKMDILVDMPQVYSLFKDYTQQYENNVLFTGIPELDSKMKLIAGTSNGLLAPPGVGKTSLVLQILEHNSNNDVPCLFYSYDMFHSALYMRMLQRQSGMQQDDIYRAFVNNPEEIRNHINALDANFKNVKFCFKSGQTIDELENSIVEAESSLGRKPKLVVVDYNELIMTGTEDDPTSSSAIVAQRLRQIANNHEVCVLTLLQPSKQFTSPSDEITNYNSIKGSSSTVQSLTLLLGCSRPGFDPLDSSEDKFFNITCLKNRNGPLFTQDLSWEGLTGRIGSLEDREYHQLRDLRDRKKAQNQAIRAY